MSQPGPRRRGKQCPVCDKPLARKMERSSDFGSQTERQRPGQLYCPENNCVFSQAAAEAHNEDT